jgi:hypothetical protein
MRCGVTIRDKRFIEDRELSHRVIEELEKVVPVYKPKPKKKKPSKSEEHL